MYRYLALLLLLCFASYWGYAQLSRKPQHVSVMERVNDTGVIRCGYWIFEPYLVKNPNTGKMSGISVEYFEKTASRMGKKVEWTEELGFDHIAPAITYGRVDAFCVPCSPTHDFKKLFDFVGSFGHIPYYVYTSAKKNFAPEDLPHARFAAVDGYISAFETRNRFPEARILSLPQITPMSDLYNQIKYGKVDAIVSEHVSAGTYMRENPYILKRLSLNPLFSKEMFFVTKKEEPAWRAFLDEMTDTQTPENKAIFQDLVKKYQLAPDALIP